jgi:ppGpp synthetase/RelA/SpoT-type nucleotidyltranferase
MPSKNTRRGAKSKTNSLSVTPDERLLLDVIEALRGADNLRDRLLTALQTGTPAVADLAYAIKSRVKEDYKVVEKIQDRRAGNGDRAAKPSYGVGNVTDLVGLRIITLYRLDILEVLEALLVTIDSDKSESAPFVAGSIAEVNIFSTNPTGDVQRLPQRVRSLVESYGLGTVTRIEEKPSNYSSIHLVLRGRGKYRDGYRELPTEIQVRTALEDVWGQIEHSLRYKRRGLVGSGKDSTENARLMTTLRHLGALKTMIDGIAQYGDQIKLQIDELEPEIRTTTSKVAEEVSARLGTLKDLPADLKDEVNAILVESRPALSDETISSDRRIRILRTGIARLEAIADAPEVLPNLKARSRKEARYIINMQTALHNFQLGNLLGGKGGYLQKAAELYRAMEEEFPLRLIVAYRLAQTLDALGARSEAVAKLRDVVRRLSEDAEPTPKDHWIRSAAPRVLGVLLWEEAKSRRDISGAGPSPDDEVLALLKEAYDLSCAAHTIDVGGDPHAGGQTSERVKAANNLLYFLLEYLEAGGQPTEGMDLQKVASFLTELGAENPTEMTSLAAADTARRAYAYLGDKAREFAAAAAVVRLGSNITAPRPAIIREAIRAAERALAIRSQTSDEELDKSADPSDGAEH